MHVAENPKKVENIVAGYIQGFKELYVPMLQSVQGLHVDVSGETCSVFNALITHTHTHTRRQGYQDRVCHCLLLVCHRFSCDALGVSVLTHR